MRSQWGYTGHRQGTQPDWQGSVLSPEIIVLLSVPHGDGVKHCWVGGDHCMVHIPPHMLSSSLYACQGSVDLTRVTPSTNLSLWSPPRAWAQIIMYQIVPFKQNIIDFISIFQTALAEIVWPGRRKVAGALSELSSSPVLTCGLRTDYTCPATLIVSLKLEDAFL